MSSVVNRCVIRAGLRMVVTLSVLWLCLFADCTLVSSSRLVGPVLAEMAFVLRDSATQWMVFACAGRCRFSLLTPFEVPTAR